MVFKNIDLQLVDWRLELDDTMDIFRIVDLMKGEVWQLSKDDFEMIAVMDFGDFYVKCEERFGREMEDEHDGVELRIIHEKIVEEFFEENTSEEEKKDFQEMFDDDETKDPDA